MKTQIMDIDGKSKGIIDLPKCFSGKIREDIVAKVLEAKKNKQPYAPSPVAGKQHSASGILTHRRKVWKSQYGKGISRIPRKIFSRRGSQFNWVGAEISSTRGGRRAHPPKIISMINSLKINKKELRVAFISAISATANEKLITEKYGKLSGKKLENIPVVIESKITEQKTKHILETLKKILGNDVFEVATKKRKIRSGKGKLRGRKYKSTAGVLVVVGKNEKLKTNQFDVATTHNLGIVDLANGGLGRLTVYTEKAIKELGEKFK
ncbi:MAG: 50S ribosomal protein L4 [Nanoarchaeota archaeon]